MRSAVEKLLELSFDDSVLIHCETVDCWWLALHLQDKHTAGRTVEPECQAPEQILHAVPADHCSDPWGAELHNVAAGVRLHLAVLFAALQCWSAAANGLVAVAHAAPLEAALSLLAQVWSAW